ncbi:MAG: hypothetical protein IJY12_05485 [Clostridia bacterium]|nr:hypothetical protein [Clostridia bacterium]
MEKIISFILVGALLLMCFSGCTSPNTPAKEDGTNGDINNTSTDGQNSGNTMELNDVFNVIRSDVEMHEKLGFSVEYEQIYNELKNSGQYANSRWLDSVFIVTVNCDYGTAINEEWYKQCSETDIKSLNAAFYNYYSAGLSKGNYSNIVFSPGMHLMYYSPEEFRNDYTAIIALTDLDYVTEVYIVYNFPVPIDYFLE